MENISEVSVHRYNTLLWNSLLLASSALHNHLSVGEVVDGGLVDIHRYSPTLR